ncbi:MAG: sensor histidine kinase, partial [Marinobacter sp.]|nr:sensor histidine kinase [Marinobacter sp.]
MKDQNIDFSMVLASAVHDMKNSLGMLLNSLDELRGEHEASLGESSRFNTLQYEAERMHNDLVQLLGIYRLGENNLSAHIEEHFVPDFLSEHLARHTPLLQ